jgi:cytolysin-activating lysine-acyltransferase
MQVTPAADQSNAATKNPSPRFDANQFASQGFSGQSSFSGIVTGAVAGSTAGKTVASILGEITWLMSQSGKHKAFMIGDLEWLVMPAVLLRQFRLYYEKDIPVGVVLFARVNAETAARLDAGAPTLRPADWQSGQGPDGKPKPDAFLRIIDHIAPFGGKDEMVKEFVGVVR